MSPSTSRDIRFERLPPGQQPHRSTATAATSSSLKARASRKASSGRRPN
uniref:Macaca fascicularis brain cDNA clone: QorA-12552, similar to human solute carrier family 10 (sodium/bile acid cotransporterfamily), member 4 (SLC10A4), mRNA, RefSeq: NM_152679.2 n=1 Tax=Macaca fascicularis TaxID=9541 RepID=I7G9N1_MACFA|nr:unnamed protein product [Macaca fascicularis]